MTVNRIQSWAQLGQRIASARKAAGLTQEFLAEELGLDRSAVSRLESGDRQLDTLELSRIAEILDRSIEWFLTQSSPAIVSRRAMVPDIPTERLRVEALIEELSLGIELLIGSGTLTPLSPLRTRGIDNLAQAEERAAEVRNTAGAQQGALRNLAAFGESIGIFGFSLAVGPPATLDGSYVLTDAGGLTLINGANDSGRRRFTFAHEIGHHVLADEYSTDWDVIIGGEGREKLINAFAIHLLMPRVAVVARWQELNGREDPRSAAIVLGAEFGVSWSAVCAHLRNLELIAPTNHLHLVETPPRRIDYVERDLGTIEELAPPTVPPRYAAAVIKAFKKHKISERRALELLRGTVQANDLPEPDRIPVEAAGDL